MFFKTKLFLLLFSLSLSFSCSKSSSKHLKGETNIKYFGVKGNGKSNDAAAFRNALANSSKIFLPKGKYLIRTEISLPDNIQIIGEKGAIIMGMFNIDGKENITVAGVEFRSWNEKVNYGIRIKKNGVKNLTISNCNFNKKSFIYQDLSSKENSSENITIENCNFSFFNKDKNLEVTTIQLHTSNLKINNCVFEAKGIDGFIKNSSGAGWMEVSNCKFSGDVDEEILDFFTFDGDVSFFQNDIQLSRGGIIRTKPQKAIPQKIKPKQINYLIHNNQITHTGNTSSLIYISGYFNLDNPLAFPPQKLKIYSNDLHCKTVCTPFNFRGLDKVEMEKNTIIGQSTKGNVSVYLSSIKSLLLKENILTWGRIMCYGTSAPGGQKYSDFIPNGTWEISKNKISNVIEKKAAIYIQKQSGLDINLVENEFDFRDFDNIAIVEFSEGNYGNIKIENNKIQRKKSRKKGNKKDVVIWGHSSQKSKSIQKNDIKQ